MKNGSNSLPPIAELMKRMDVQAIFNPISRFCYDIDVDYALAAIEAIGKSRNPNFVIDDENRFAYENIVRWLHCDKRMKALDPKTGQITTGRLSAGIYIAGNTGTGKSWCLEIIMAYCKLMNFAFKKYADANRKPLYSRPIRADDICEKYVENGTIGAIKDQPILCIQDLGSETHEAMHMGNRVDVIRQLIECRGDNNATITLITSNLKMNGEAMQKRYGDRVVSRLNGMCNYFEIKGKDRRRTN